MAPSIESIRRGQLARLRLLLAQIRAGNGFYRARLEAAGADVADLETFRSAVPFTRKQELVEDQRAHPPYGTNLTFPLERYTRMHQTSGTSGAPLRWLDTPESWDAMVGSWGRILGAAGVDASDRVFFAFGFGPFLGFWLAFEAAERRGCLCIAGGGMTSRLRLHALVDNGATVLCATPTYAIHLGEIATDAGIDLAARMRRIIVAGEPGGSIPAIRSRIEAAWPGSQVHDHHGMTEVGPMSYQCPEQPGTLHLMEDAYFAEVVEPGGDRPAADGETGELVVTTLERVGSPLLRYRTGDLVRATRGPCRCGSGELALEGGILGRADDMVVVRGVNVYPSAIDALVRVAPEVAEYRVEQSTAGALTELAILIEPTAACADPAELSAAVQSALAAGLGLRIPVTATAPGTLPRFEMKASRWVRR